jgi:hypothetical protein
VTFVASEVVIHPRRWLLDATVIVAVNGLAFFTNPRSSISVWGSYSLITAAFLFVLRDFGRRGGIGMVMFVGGLVLYVYPYLGEILRGSDVSFVFFTLYILIAWLLIELSPTARFIRVGKRDGIYRHMTIAALLLAFIGLHLWIPIYVSCYGIAIICFERYCRLPHVTMRHVLTPLFAFFALLTYYINIVFVGFGRLSVLTYAILPALILFQHGIVRIRRSYLVLLAPVGLIYGSMANGQEEISTITFAGDSASHHLLMMSTLRSDPWLAASDLPALLKQFTLYFVNWFPRDLWPSKPIGIGLSFVDDYIGRGGFSEGHSVSLGLWGEHIFLNSATWLLTGLAVVAVSAICARVLYRVSFRSAGILLIFQAHFLTLVWGGMASFGSRVWWMVLPALAYIWIERSIWNVVPRFSEQKTAMKCPMRPVPSP